MKDLSRSPSTGSGQRTAAASAFAGQPVAMLNARAPAELRRIFPAGVPVTTLEPAEIADLVAQNPEAPNGPALVYNLDVWRCTAVQLSDLVDVVVANCGGKREDAVARIAEIGMPLQASLVLCVWRITKGGGPT